MVKCYYIILGASSIILGAFIIILDTFIIIFGAFSIMLGALSDCCEQILISDPGARIIIAGDVNHLRISEFSRQHNLEQLVKKPTRGQNTLDVFLTNYPYIWKSPTMFISLVRSDHLAIMVSPQTPAKAERENVFIRDVREHRKIEMDKRLKEHNWADVNDTNDVDEAVCTLSNVIENMFNDCFPLIKVRVSSKDPPFMTPLVKPQLIEQDG